MCENFRAVIIQRARSYFLTIKHFSITLISVFQNLQKTLSQIALKTDGKKKKPYQWHREFLFFLKRSVSLGIRKTCIKPC
ncbi:hypothetical protein FIM72_04525 [Helicobacter pylori]|nr:hypothetical protein FIM72_04525 [Helicobacter pylori]